MGVSVHASSSTTRADRTGRWERFTGPHPAEVAVRLEVAKGGYGNDAAVGLDVFVVIEGREQWLARAARLGEQLDAQLGEYGVILQPPYSRPAPRHRHRHHAAAHG